jgi:hypothetical protein
MKRLAFLVLLPLAAAAPAIASPLSDCIDKLTANCKGDWGDATYRACFKGATSHCESTHPKPAPKGMGLTTPGPKKSLMLRGTPSSLPPG